MWERKALGALGRPIGAGLKRLAKALGGPQPNGYQNCTEPFIQRPPNAPNAFCLGGGEVAMSKALDEFLVLRQASEAGLLVRPSRREPDCLEHQTREPNRSSLLPIEDAALLVFVIGAAPFTFAHRKIPRCPHLVENIYLALCRRMKQSSCH